MLTFKGVHLYLKDSSNGMVLLLDRGTKSEGNHFQTIGYKMNNE